MWGNPLQNSGCSLELVELIPLQPKKLNIERAERGNQLQIYGHYLQMCRLCWTVLWVQERIIISGWCDNIKFEIKALRH